MPTLTPTPAHRLKLPTSHLYTLCDNFFHNMIEQPAETTIWTDADHVSQIDEVLAIMGPAIRVTGIGGPRLAGVDLLARRLGCEHQDDLRKLLLNQPARFLLFASMDGVNRDDLRLATQHHTHVLTLEPIASEFSELPFPKPRAGTPGTPENATWIPAFDQSPGWTSVADPDHALVTPQLIGFDSFGLPGDCSLFARLFDAWQTILRLGTLPEQIDASLAGPLGEIPENLRGITGHLGAHARLSNGGIVALRVSDRAGPIGRNLHVIGQQGHLSINDTGYCFYNTDGHCIDQKPDAPTATGFAALIAFQWSNLMSPSPVPPTQEPAPTHAAVLACCLACVLSARTGQPESPNKLMQLHGL